MYITSFSLTYTKLRRKLLTVSFVSRVANVSDLWARFGAFENICGYKTMLSTNYIYVIKKEEQLTVPEWENPSCFFIAG